MKSLPDDFLGSSRLVLLAVAILAWLCKAVPMLPKDAPSFVIAAGDYLGQYSPRLVAGSAFIAGVAHLRSIERWQRLILPLSLLLALTGLHFHGRNSPNEVGQIEEHAMTGLTLAFPFAVLFPLGRRGPRGLGAPLTCVLAFGVGLALGYMHPQRATTILHAGLGLPANSNYAPLAVAFIAALAPLVLSRKYGLTVAVATFAAALLPPLWGDAVRLSVCIVGMALSSI